MSIFITYLVIALYTAKARISQARDTDVFKEASHERDTIIKKNNEVIIILYGFFITLRLYSI